MPRKNKSFFYPLLATIAFALLTQPSQAQVASADSILSLEAYLGYVKKFHPLVKQANLEVSQAQAGILAARGGFDPKIEVDYDKKQFKSTDYFRLLNSTFKIPTWYGVEIKAGFEQMDGFFLNPQNTVPVNGLATLGLAVPIGQGLLINKRMADLRKAKLYANLTQAERDLEITTVMHQAAVSYFEWYKNHNEYQLYATFLNNAQIRLKGIKGLIEQGDRPAIDSIEAGILVGSRELNLEQSRLKLVKSKLELATFLWWENNIPVELQEGIVPEKELDKNVTNTLKTNSLTLEGIALEDHPKIKSLQNKLSILEVDKRFKGDLLKPKIDLNYNYLSEPELVRDFNTLNYKFGIQFSVPLFLRKERGEYKIAQFKVQEANLALNLENQVLQNKIKYQLEEIESLKAQIKIQNKLVADVQTLLVAEERLLFFGESSLFLINTRENSLLSNSLQQLDVTVKYCFSNADLFKLLAVPN